MVIKYTLSFLGSFLLGVFFIRLSERLNLRNRLISSAGTPLLGGISFGAAFLLVSLSSLLSLGIFSKEAVGIILAAGAMLIFGLFDDWRELSVRSKFAFQVIAASVLVFFGVRTHIIYLGAFLNILITFIWIVGITNAFNHLDVMDGLAGGAALIISLSFFAVSLLNADLKSAFLSLALAGSVLGFFLRNCPPAKIYMGNCGSHFLGFVLSAVALMISYAPVDRKVALVSPLLILGLPIFDTAFLILIRLAKKSLPFNKSNDHLALRFLALGYSKRRSLSAMLILCAIFCLSGIAVSRAPNLPGAAIIALIILLSLLIAFKMKRVTVHG